MLKKSINDRPAKNRIASFAEAFRACCFLQYSVINDNVRVMACPHWRPIRRLLPKPATVAEFGNSRRFRRQIVAEIGDYSLQCGKAISLIYKMLNVKCSNDYGVQNDESLRGQCTNERKVRKRDKKVSRDVI